MHTIQMLKKVINYKVINKKLDKYNIQVQEFKRKREAKVGTRRRQTTVHSAAQSHCCPGDVESRQERTEAKGTQVAGQESHRPHLQSRIESTPRPNK